MIKVQQQDFDVNEQYQALIADDSQSGAVVMFVGRVRDMNQGHNVQSLYLEHYPAMTQKYLEQLEANAMQRWDLEKVTVIHRFGQLEVTDQIVLVAVSSQHREAAFEAAQFIMDLLKTQAPFWKKELNQSGDNRWVEAHQKDQIAAQQW